MINLRVTCLISATCVALSSVHCGSSAVPEAGIYKVEAEIQPNSAPECGEGVDPYGSACCEKYSTQTFEIEKDAQGRLTVSAILVDHIPDGIAWTREGNLVDGQCGFVTETTTSLEMLDKYKMHVIAKLSCSGQTTNFDCYYAGKAVRSE